jgi:hypothetical protein
VNAELETALNERQRGALREQALKALDRVPTDGSTTNWRDVYVPESHLQALAPNRMVVEGMRGCGKSFWTGVLANDALRQALSNQPLGVELREELGGIAESHAITLDVKGATGSPLFPNSAELSSLLRRPGVTPDTIWIVAILRLFPVDPELGIASSTDVYDPWTAPVTWAGEHTSRIARALDLLDQKLTSDRKTALVVFDALDRASNDLAEVSAVTAGLLRVMLNLRFAKGLRLKAFIREDVLARAGASVVDGSKLLNNRVKLQWTQTDLYGLAFYRIAQDSATFRTQFERIARATWRDSGGRYQCAAANEPTTQKKVWKALVGDYMGKAATSGHSYPYIYNHLSDGLDRVAPRTFLTALREAVRSALKSYPDKPNVMHPEAIKDGVREASTARVVELREEYQWIDSALQCIKEKQKTVPIDKIDLEKIWVKDGASVLQAIEALRNIALIPWRSGATNSEKIEGLRTTLEQIGIIKLRLRDGNERIELPDIYRLAYKIGRHGGISTHKKA